MTNTYKACPHNHEGILAQLSFFKWEVVEEVYPRDLKSYCPWSSS